MSQQHVGLRPYSPAHGGTFEVRAGRLGKRLTRFGGHAREYRHRWSTLQRALEGISNRFEAGRVSEYQFDIVLGELRAQAFRDQLRVVTSCDRKGGYHPAGLLYGGGRITARQQEQPSNCD